MSSTAIAHLNLEVEANIYKTLYEHFLPVYGDRISSYVDSIVAIDHYLGRFDWLLETLSRNEANIASPILISGFSAGSEMIAARQSGFQQVYGVEVDPFLVSTTVTRTQYFDDFFPTLYDGQDLPFEDSTFAVVASGHIIEHTNDPFLYLCECLRVLKPGGYLALEFPNRFHRTELHTGLPSLEWLPMHIRNSLLKLITCKFSLLSLNIKNGYRSILGTNLKQISMGKVKSYVKKSGYNYSILRIDEVAPGVIRTAIRKNTGTDST